MDQLARLTQPSQHIQPGTVPAGTFDHLTRCLPAVGHYGEQTKSGFITVEQIDVARSAERLQVG